MFQSSISPRALVVTALVATSTLVTTPSSAADTWTTTTVATPSETVVQFGETFDVDVDLDSSSGTPPTQGTSTLLALRAGAGAWTPVATNDSPGDDFADVEPTLNTIYKVVYSGHTSSAAGQDSYGSSESAEFQINVSRKITYPKDGFVLKGRVTPDYTRRPVSIRVSKSRDSGFKKYRTIKTNARGRYKITLPRRDGDWYWRVAVRGDARFIATSYTWQTSIFH